MKNFHLLMPAIFSKAEMFCRSPIRLWSGLLVFCLLASGILSACLGQAYGFDAQNYHIYNAWAFLNGRWNADVHAAGIHSYLTPLTEIPYYWLAFVAFPHSPRCVAFFMGLPFGLLFFLAIYAHARIVFLARGNELGKLATLGYAFLLSLFGMSGFAAISQFASASNEITVACFVLGAIAILLRFHNHPFASALACGGLLGFAAGLKFTAVIYAPALFLCLFVCIVGLREKAIAALLFLFAFAALFLVSYGWWGWFLLRETGNPFLPLLNHIFHSDWLGTEAMRYERFLPRSPRQILFYPFYWVDSAAVADDKITDIRPLLAQVVAGITFVYHLLFRLNPARTNESSGIEIQTNKNTGNRKILPAFLLFVGVSYVIWEAQFSILRYAIPIEALLGGVVFVCIASLQTAEKSRFRHHPVLAILLAFLLFSVGTGKNTFTHYGVCDDSFVSGEIPRLPEKSLVMLGPITSFLAPVFQARAPDILFVGGVAEGSPELPETGPALKQKIGKKLSNHEGPLFLLVSDAPRFAPEKLFPRHGVEMEGTAETFQTNWGRFRLYRLKKATRKEPI